MKNIISWIILLVMTSRLNAQNIISTNIMSINGWRPDVVGGGTNPLDSNQCEGLKSGINIPCKVNGGIDTLWKYVRTIGTRFVRYGGITADQNRPTQTQYLNFVDSVRKYGMEPILQIQSI